MRIYTNLTTAVNEAAAVPFKMGLDNVNSMIAVRGVLNGATVILLVNTVDTGVFLPALDPYGVQQGIFTKNGIMAIDGAQGSWGKLIVSGGGGSQSITVDYGV